jgi:hypothetical protein
MKPTRWYSSRQEKAIAKVLNGKQQSNSGATKLIVKDLLDIHIQ